MTYDRFLFGNIICQYNVYHYYFQLLLFLLPSNSLYHFNNMIFKFLFSFFRNCDGNSMRCENDIKSNYTASSSNIINVIGERKRKVRTIKDYCYSKCVSYNAIDFLNVTMQVTLILTIFSASIMFRIIGNHMLMQAKPLYLM